MHIVCYNYFLLENIVLEIVLHIHYNTANTRALWEILHVGVVSR